jgi:hypothetical protein
MDLFFRCELTCQAIETRKNAELFEIHPAATEDMPAIRALIRRLPEQLACKSAYVGRAILGFHVL